MSAPIFSGKFPGGETFSLEFRPHGMANRLSETGVGVVCQVGGRLPRAFGAAPPGANYSRRTTVGSAARRILWQCQLRSDLAIDLDEIEAIIDRLVYTGAGGRLVDRFGRSFEHVVLESAPKHGPRLPCNPGVLQRCGLNFVVLLESAADVGSYGTGFGENAPPGTPTTWGVVNLSSSGFSANWEANAAATQGYTIDVANDPAFTSPVVSADPGDPPGEPPGDDYVDTPTDDTWFPVWPDFEDKGIQHTVYYRVRAWNALGASEYSSTEQVILPAA